MKKTLVLGGLVAVVALFAGCSNEETQTSVSSSEPVVEETVESSTDELIELREVPNPSDPIEQQAYDYFDMLATAYHTVGNYPNNGGGKFVIQWLENNADVWFDASGDVYNWLVQEGVDEVDAMEMVEMGYQMNYIIGDYNMVRIQDSEWYDACTTMGDALEMMADDIEGMYLQ